MRQFLGWLVSWWVGGLPSRPAPALAPALAPAPAPPARCFPFRTLHFPPLCAHAYMQAGTLIVSRELDDARAKIEAELGTYPRLIHGRWAAGVLFLLLLLLPQDLLPSSPFFFPVF
jgi:hypothetical protein